MKFEKGFTIIEVIITIAVIAVIGLTSFIGFSNVTKQTKEKQYQSIIKDIKTAAEVFLENKKELKEELYKEEKLAQYIKLGTLIELNLVENNIKDPRTNNPLSANSLVKIYLLEDNTLYYEYPGTVEDITAIVGTNPLYINKGTTFDCYKEMSGITKSGNNIALNSKNATCTHEININTTGTYKAYYNIIGNFFEENNPKTYEREVIVVELVLGAFSTSSSTLGNTYYSKLIRSITISSNAGLESIQYCTTTGSSCTPTTNYSMTSGVTSQIVNVTFGSNASAQRVCVKATDKMGNTQTKCDTSTFKVDISAPTGVTIAVSSTTTPNVMNIKGTDSESGIWKYICQWSTSSTFSSYSSTTVTTTATSTTCNLGTITYGTTYYVRVETHNNSGLTTTSGAVKTTALNPNDIISINPIATTTIYKGDSFNCYTGMTGTRRNGSTVALSSSNATCTSLNTTTVGTKYVDYTIKAGLNSDGSQPTYTRTVKVNNYFVSNCNSSTTNYIQITNQSQLSNIRSNPTGNYILMNDITITGTFTPIPTFSGILCGNNKVINNLNLTTGSSNVGFIQILNGTVESLGLKNVNIVVTSTWDVGGLAGDNKGQIRDSYVTGLISANGGAGGVAGKNSGTITYSYSTATVRVDQHTGNAGGTTVGGLVGSNSGIITNSYATGTVKAAGYYVGGTVGDYAGGLVGYNSANGSITNTFATGPVSGRRHDGGLIGENKGTVSYSYAMGTVTGGGSAGGFIGYNNGGTIKNSYFNKNKTGKSYSCGTGGTVCDSIICLTDDQSKVQTNYSGWDFTNTWQMNIYPTIRGLPSPY